MTFARTKIQPPRWTVAMTSRTDPPLSLARLRAADELAEFRQLQLQFARDEARQLTVGAGLDERLADRLFDRTQGWPAALRIAVGAVQASGAGGGEARALRARSGRWRSWPSADSTRPPPMWRGCAARRCRSTR